VIEWIVPFTSAGRDLAFLMMSTTAIGVLLSYGSHRIPALERVAPHVLLATFFLMPLGSTFVLGGLSAPTIPFLVVVPMLATQLVGRRAAISWSLAVGVAIGGLILADRLDVEIPSVMRAANRPIVLGIVQYLVVVAVVGVALRNASVNQRLRADLAVEQARFAELAGTDSLTGVANRRRLDEHLDLAAERARRGGNNVGVAVFDLDGFKEINDELGHAAGDAVLCACAERLASITRRTDLVARLGGDEFAVVLEGVPSRDELESVARMLANRIRQPIDHRGDLLACGASVGTALFPADTGDLVELLEMADGAMYRSKKRDRQDADRDV
jgi:diguanylate cyclase (GGDEF)-like protein